MRKLLLLMGIALLLIGVSLSIGSLSWHELKGFASQGQDELLRTILFRIRAPRVFLSFLVGASLAVSGLVCQVTLRNPLADPYLLGISSGATLGAVFSIGFLHGGATVTFLLAFAGSLAGLAATLLASGHRRWSEPSSLVLSGAIVSFFGSAMAMLGISLLRGPDLPGVIFWIAGDCSLATYSSVLFVLLVLALLMSFTMIRSRDLELLETGEEEARSLGVQTKSLLRTSLIVASLASSVCVATVGMIGFVGLMIPHFARGYLGFRIRRASLGALLLGGISLTAADLVARSIPSVGELPVGSLTALIGCPFLLWMLRRGVLL